jgi:drug/metabolite transporter (DMT)-like permease
VTARDRAALLGRADAAHRPAAVRPSGHSRHELGHFPILKFAARSGLPYSGIAAATICGVALALLAISIARGRLPVFQPRTVRFYLVCAFLGYLVPYFLALFATGRIDADMVTLITSTSLIITLCLAAVVGVERVSSIRVLGIGFGLASVLFPVVPQVGRIEAMALTAIILAFGVPASYSSYHVYLAKRWPAGFDSFQVACGEALIALGLMLPVFLATGGDEMLRGGWTTGHWAILAMVVITTIDAICTSRSCARPARSSCRR